MIEIPASPWNDFVARATYQAERVTAEEPLYALFWYYSEVNNGGHLQYFLNRIDPSEWSLALSTARSIGQSKVGDNLEVAMQVWKSAVRVAPGNVEEYVEQALKGEFDAFDQAYYELDPALFAALERIVEERKAAGDASGN